MNFLIFGDFFSNSSFLHCISLFFFICIFWICIFFGFCIVLKALFFKDFLVFTFVNFLVLAFFFPNSFFPFALPFSFDMYFCYFHFLIFCDVWRFYFLKFFFFFGFLPWVNFSSLFIETFDLWNHAKPPPRTIIF